MELGSCPQSPEEAPDGSKSDQGATSLLLSTQNCHIPSSVVATVDLWGPLTSGNPNSPKILYYHCFNTC